jgi:hypothetical protein
VRLYPEYPYLKRLWEHLLSGEDLHIEKSRQMMLSWSIMIYLLHQVLFEKNKQFLVISAKQSLADDGGKNSTPQSLLGKVRFVYERLPVFLRKDKSGRDLLEFKSMAIVCLSTNSVIKAETTADNAGRGGNYNRIFIDEAAYIPDSEAIFTAARLACKKGMIICSTPNGKNNILWRLRYANSDSGFINLRYHWSDHPERDEMWYRKQSRSMTEAQIARELDIKYDIVISGVVYPEFDYAIHVADEKLTFNSGLPFHTSWDFGIADPTAILFIQTDSNDNILIIDEYQDSGKDSFFYAMKVKEIIAGWGLGLSEIDNLLRWSTHYGDPAGKQRGARLESWIGDLYNRLGIIIKTKPGVLKLDKINRVKVILREGKLLVSPSCTGFITALQHYRRETDRTGRVLSEKPIHDITSHFNDAFQEFVINRYPLAKQTFETFRIEI